MKQEIIYISKLVITSFAILIYLVVLITYIFRKAQNGLLYFYNMLLIFFGIIHSSSILIMMNSLLRNILHFAGTPTII